MKENRERQRDRERERKWKHRYQRERETDESLKKGNKGSTAPRFRLPLPLFLLHRLKVCVPEGTKGINGITGKRKGERVRVGRVNIGWKENLSYLEV